MIQSSGAEYSYFMVAFGPFSAYMFSWVSTIIIKPSQLAIICLSFAEYIAEAFTVECAPPTVILKVIGVTTVGKEWAFRPANMFAQLYIASSYLCILVPFCKHPL